MDSSVFCGSGIESLKLPKSLKHIGGYTFYKCNKLKWTIVIPDGVTAIEMYTFGRCSSLSAILVPDSVKTVSAYDYEVFKDCSTTVFGSQGSVIQKYREKNNVKFKVFALDKKNVEMAEGESCILKTNLNSKELIEACTWTSSDESVATVTQDGKVETLKNGKTTITATTENGIKATCEIRVGTEPESITLSKTNLTLNVGVKYAPKVITTLEVAVTKYTWTSSDESVATVNKFGNITTVSEGTAIITATTAGGKTAQCEVTVKRMADIVTLSKKSWYCQENKNLL